MKVFVLMEDLFSEELQDTLGFEAVKAVTASAQRAQDWQVTDGQSHEVHDGLSYQRWFETHSVEDMECI